MRIGGYGEFQQMRKLASKEDSQNKDKLNKESDAALVQAGDDAVQISGEARRKIKMRQASDFREAKVAEVREKLNAGTLVSPESLKSGTTKMLQNLINGDL